MHSEQERRPVAQVSKSSGAARDGAAERNTSSQTPTWSDKSLVADWSGEAKHVAPVGAHLVASTTDPPCLFEHDSVARIPALELNSQCLNGSFFCNDSAIRIQLQANIPQNFVAFAHAPKREYSAGESSDLGVRIPTPNRVCAGGLSRSNVDISAGMLRGVSGTKRSIVTVLRQEVELLDRGFRVNKKAAFAQAA